MAPVLFRFIPEVLPCRMMFLMLRPLEFELRGFSSRPDLQKLCDDYITSDHKDDIWLKRSPMSPDIPVVRHSLYTPKEIFHASRFYKHVMLRVGCEYGCSLVAWRNDTWLGNVTLFRSEDQGDFRDDEMEKLNDCCQHFQSAILRIATVQEERLASKTLATLVWDLPTAAVVLDWNLKPLFWNASSHELISEWKHGLRRGSVKALRQFVVPPEIAESVEKAKRKPGQYQAESAQVAQHGSGGASAPSEDPGTECRCFLRPLEVAGRLARGASSSFSTVIEWYQMSATATIGSPN